MAGANETPEEESDGRSEPEELTDSVDREFVGELATLQDWMDLDVENVIGIFGKPDDMRALLRRPDGETLKVKAGDAALGGRVHAIDSEAVVIVKNARALVFRVGKAPSDPAKSKLR